MSAKERRCRQADVGGAAVAEGVAEGVLKPRNRGTGPKLFSKYVTRELLQGQFHLPMEEAGRSWGVSTTIVKRVCRTFGIERWPYRQIQSTRKRIDKLKEKIRAGTRDAAEQEKIKVNAVVIFIDLATAVARSEFLYRFILSANVRLCVLYTSSH